MVFPITIKILKRILDFRVISKETIGIVITWGAYFMATIFIDDPATKNTVPAILIDIIPMLFWPTVVISSLSFAMACFKSVLPPIIVLLTSIALTFTSLSIAGYPVSKITLLIAMLGITIHAIGYVFYASYAHNHKSVN